ncbi:isoflavone 2'-hydroxylase [Cicer arietinum]|uniref:Cytochrome P450 n=1 Tax=Cicer arietinum TaxID=3827 RepID=Q9ZRW6_CICAR|nr:isoflavone 2'-hydroxylase [Cicer arietinum]CAA10067.1 cytochrome P450 [Cicer arietinum]
MGILSLLCYSLFYLSFFFIIRLLFQSRKFKNLPPGPPSLPIIGNLHHLKRPLHRTFKGLSKTYGDIISLWFGSRLVVVVSSLSEFQQCFTKNDVVLANRPRFLSGKYIFYNYTTLGSTSYSEHWRNLRRITSLDVLSNHRINNFSGVRRDETQRLITKLAEDSSTSFAEVELSFRFYDMTFNNIMRMIPGKRYYGEDCDMSDLQEASQFRDMVTELLQLSGANNKTDFMPLLKFFDFENLEKRVKNIADKTDAFLRGLLQEQRNKKERTNTMIDHLLNLQESQPEYYTDQIIKGLALAMLLAGTDSSAVTLEWSMSNLLNHPEILKKVKDELDIHVGQDRLVDESDLPKLTYLKNVIYETLRLCTPAPLLLPHSTSDDCIIGGYKVPRDTIVLINAWAIHRDPKSWSEATSFKPERFDKKGEIEKVIAFGMGRRVCPGEALALRTISMTLALLVQCFDWKRTSDDKIDMAERDGFVLTKLIPLKAMCKTRPVVNKVFK